MTLPPDAPDCWVRMTTHGTLHYVSKGQKTTACGIPAQNAIKGMEAEWVDKLPDYERPARCHTCLQAARKEGHK